ncbi:hypothetical protein [Clostridium perfringens]|nr:hypothetical protein [Clostridium perfringens]MDK0851282.1 hypothetical protein [Clostridium perfringens]MDK0961162.1 hypothetical protein [Clostridium perfringens]MDK0969952.1 hypothetical protein [Clostridium perfringens]MDM0619814.1 hypothetical protein [Clostridium perfringens]MDM0648781.1 hypothetical protein [Clostridium perfringens]
MSSSVNLLSKDVIYLRLIVEVKDFCCKYGFIKELLNKLLI